MKFKGTWFLLTVAVLLGAYIYFIEIKKTAKDEQAKETAEKILTVDASKVKSIDVKNSHGLFKLERNDGKTWEMTVPVRDTGDESEISGMLNGLNNEKYDQEIEGEDLKTYGLDNPAISATFTTTDGKTEKIDVGIDSPLPGKVYVERNGDKKVLFANLLVKTNLDKELKDLRDKRIFRKNKDDVKTITLQYNTPTNHSDINIVRKDLEWDVNGTNTADPDAVTGLLNTIDSLRATDFVSEKADDKNELKKYDLNKPEILITLTDKDKKPLAEISVSPKKDNNIYITVAGSPTIYKTYVGAAEQLMHTVSDFRDKKGPFNFKRDDVKEIQIKTSLTDVHLLKKGNSWELATPDQKMQPDQIRIESFIDRIASFRVSEFVEKEKPKGLNPPQGTIIFKNGEGKNVFTLAWGDKTKSGKSLFVKTDKSDNIVALDASSITTLPMQTLIEEVKPASSPVPGKIDVKPPLPSTADHP